MNKMDTMRELRMNKVAVEMMDHMNDLLDKMENVQELMDVIAAWMQVLGACLAALEGAPEKGAHDFVPFMMENLEAAYVAKWRYLNGIAD